MEQQLLGELGKVDQDIEADDRVDGGCREIDSGHIGVQEGCRRHESAGPIDLDFADVDPRHGVTVRSQRSGHWDTAAASQIQGRWPHRADDLADR